MASNGLLKEPKTGTCRMCRRARNAEKHLKKVGEVIHGFACGYVWECTDTEGCDAVVKRKLEDPATGYIKRGQIEQAVEIGRFTTYKTFS